MSTRAEDVAIRPARPDDLPRLTEIYNHYVIHTPITFDLHPFAVEQRLEWFGQFQESGPHRLLVADVAGVFAAYACSHQFRTKAAYDTTVEFTVYCTPDHVGRGVGTALYRALLNAIRGEDVRMIIAGITLPNDASVALHERSGFKRAGLFHAVGRKFGQYWDVAWYEREL
jgi:phosphinothricin acetyltransferase